MIPAIVTGVMIPARRPYLLAAIPAIIPTGLVETKLKNAKTLAIIDDSGFSTSYPQSNVCSVTGR